jgi:uncharacterized protein (TIGR03067 family)
VRLSSMPSRASAFATALCVALLASPGSPAADAPVPVAFQPLQGSWVVSAAEQSGKPFDAIKGGRLTIQGETFDLETAAGTRLVGKLKLDAAVTPHHLDFLLSNGPVWLAIYSVSATTFRLNYVEDDNNTKRPTVFATTADTPGTVIVMRKADPAAH